MDIITRADARFLGLPRYFTGKPCRHGHVAARRVVDCACVACRQSQVPAGLREHRSEQRLGRERRVEEVRAVREARRERHAGYRAEDRAARERRRAKAKPVQRAEAKAARARKRAEAKAERARKRAAEAVRVAEDRAHGVQFKATRRGANLAREQRLAARHHDLQIITRTDARRLGLPYYFTEPCINGHRAARRVVDGNCTFCLRHPEERNRGKPQARLVREAIAAAQQAAGRALTPEEQFAVIEATVK